MSAKNTRKNLIQHLIEFVAKQFRLSTKDADKLVNDGLIPFVDAASTHPGLLYPPPAVAEVLDVVEQCGDPQAKSLASKAVLAEPSSEAELVRAYQKACDLVAPEHQIRAEEVWVDSTIYRGVSAGCCKYMGNNPF